MSETQREREAAYSDSDAWIADPHEAEPAEYAKHAYQRLLQLAERGEWQREGLLETPLRAAKAWAELTRGYRMDPAEVFKTFESNGYDEMVVVRDIPFYSLCEHHLLPFHGHAHIGYVPDHRILGLSKFARVVEIFARRLQVQEKLTQQVADAIVEHLEPRGVIVIAEAEHLCMSMRGAQVPGTITTTSAVRGVFKEQPETRAEGLALVRSTAA